MNTHLLRRVPIYDIYADDNRDPAWMEFVSQIGDGDEVWECLFLNDATDLIGGGAQGLVLLREGVEVASFPPTPERRRMN